MSSHDIRYQQDKWSSKRKASSRVALMYLPLLTAVTTDLSFLNLLHLDFENGNDTSKNKFDNDNELVNNDSYKCKRLMILYIILNDNYFSKLF